MTDPITALIALTIWGLIQIMEKPELTTIHYHKKYSAHGAGAKVVAGETGSKKWT